MDDIPTHLLVDGVKYACNAKAIPFFVRQKGDTSRGTIMVVLIDLNGEAQVFKQERNLDFVLGWKTEGLMRERNAEEMVQTALGRDPDQWIIEIEDPQMRFPFEGPVF